MAITFDCPCGKQLKVADEFAGKRARCPACQNILDIPEAGYEIVDEPVKTAVAQRDSREEDDEVEEERPRRKRPRREEDEDDEEEHRPRRKRLTDDGSPRRRKRKKSEVEQTPQSLEGRVANGGVMGGIAAMVIAVVWFVVGLMCDFLFYYPPILFVIGFVGVIRGLISSDDD